MWICGKPYSSNYESAHQEAVVGFVLPASLKMCEVFWCMLVQYSWHTTDGMRESLVRGCICAHPQSQIRVKARGLPGTAYEHVHKVPRETRVQLLTNFAFFAVA